MNCDQAKTIKIENFLYSLGKKPERVYGVFLWYKSPLRKDEKPSFKVDTRKNSWYDIGTGTGGDIISLVMAMNCTNVAGALLILQRPEISKQSFSFPLQQKQSKPGIEIRHIQPLQNKVLIQYLYKRKIDVKTASKYLMEAYYRAKEKQYFALAFQNDKGGFELRNSYHKCCNSPKYLTTIPGETHSLNIFEGFMDFLSALTFYKTSKPRNRTVILNTVENLKYAEQLIKSACQVNAYLDNDTAGEKAFNRVADLNPNATNQAVTLYPGYKDFNDFICNNPLK
ncbi:toprim domain-containing protein [Gaoshiqia sp. Z1-71]|uniref:toprim domain-containing protein n=1 Tax=Gaoshiqia hydrogeniformans TaxID=3290090 RepID=UPI003BF85ECA